MNYITSYTNITNLTTSQVCESINNSTYNCIGEISGTISVIPYNQDIQIVLLTIISICLLLLVIFQIWEKIG